MLNSEPQQGFCDHLGQQILILSILRHIFSSWTWLMGSNRELRRTLCGTKKKKGKTKSLGKSMHTAVHCEERVVGCHNIQASFHS